MKHLTFNTLMNEHLLDSRLKKNGEMQRFLLLRIDFVHDSGRESLER
jgi:hypothetical protein